jgi:hypothetical protein
MQPSRAGLLFICILSLSLACVLQPVLTFCYDVENIQIQLSPNVLYLGSQGEVVTVHTDLPYASVKGASVFLNGVPISWWKSDDRGYFVAKFNIDQVKQEAGLVVGLNTVLFTGLTIDNVQFTGTRDLKVVSNDPKGNNLR